jgi:hypothetical protein
MNRPLRFVVLWHDGIPQPHFDLMFESEPHGRLITYRSPAWPLVEPTDLIPLGEHRREYLTYEGPVSGNRGQVRRVAEGTFEWRTRAADRLEIQLLTPIQAIMRVEISDEGRATAHRV